MINGWSPLCRKIAWTTTLLLQRPLIVGASMCYALNMNTVFTGESHATICSTCWMRCIFRSSPRCIRCCSIRPLKMRHQLRAVAARSTRLMVMNGLAIDMLAEVYGIDVRKVEMVHHGAPALTTPTATAILKRQLGCAAQRIIATFGLFGTR